MSDPLNPYPGNLKRHEVRPKVMDNTDLELLILRSNDMEGLEHVRDTYEAARAKDAELIQRLVDDLRRLRIEYGNHVGQTTQIGIASLAAAEAHGFKPTEL